MRFLKYLAAPWAAVVFYALASFIAGDAGFLAYKDFDSGRRKQIENIADLRRLNTGLNAERDSLRSDPDTIAREALSIGYGRDGESYIRIEGFHDSRKNELRSGEILKPAAPDAVQDEALKIYAIGIFIIMLGTLGVTDILRFIKNA